MSTAVLSPGRLSGDIKPPPSKSAAHRAILCAALAQGESVLSPVALSDDIKATIAVAEALGASIRLCGEVLTVSGIHPDRREGGTLALSCGESGSTLRFFIPVAAALGRSAVFTGEGKLPTRPIGVYLDCLPKAGVACRTKGGLPLAIDGQLKPGVFSLPGDVSSQFITGLLFALPLLCEDSEIRLTTPLQSAGYIDLTLQILAEFGVTVEPIPGGWRVPGGQRYRAKSCTVESDWSQAAFFLAGAAFGSDLTLTGLRLDSVQGDKAALTLFEGFGVEVEKRADGSLRCTPPSGRIWAQDIDAAQIPDLVPILAVTAALADGDSRIYNAQRLRIKESDRLKTTAALIQALGGQCEETQAGLFIHGVKRFTGGTVDGANDHRIVMAAAMAALAAQGEVTIRDAQAINKSYPSFFDEYNRLGGHVHGIHLG